jgi:pyruvate dehydrogenase E2 component (dihydrolipoamide acetyltransferase)
MSIEMTLPVLGEKIDSATVVQVLVSSGDKISENQPIVEVDTEKASVEVPASASGTVQQVRVKQGDVVKVGQVLLTLDDDGRPAETKTVDEPAMEDASRPSAQHAEADKSVEKPKPVEKQEAKPANRGLAAASPKLRRMARELAVDIGEVQGTGPDGRITEEDVRNHARSIIASAGPVKGVDGQVPDFSRWGDIERKPMSAVRRKTAEHVQDAWTIPHVTHFDSADITELEQLRTRYAPKAEGAGGKLTLTAIALRVVASALLKFPQVNTSLNTSNNEIVFKKYCHIGVAADTERGLLVPVIRDVDKKNILELAIELTQIAEKARQGHLSIEEMQGGTFTITNLGGIGGTNFTPIINSPQVAILGISRASHQAVFKDGQFVPRLILPLALSFDHRAIDGADAARFLRWVVESLEQPFLLAFEG